MIPSRFMLTHTTLQHCACRYQSKYPCSTRGCQGSWFQDFIYFFILITAFANLDLFHRIPATSNQWFFLGDSFILSLLFFFVHTRMYLTLINNCIYSLSVHNLYHQIWGYFVFLQWIMTWTWHHLCYFRHFSRHGFSKHTQRVSFHFILNRSSKICLG